MAILVRRSISVQLRAVTIRLAAEAGLNGTEFLSCESLPRSACEAGQYLILPPW